MRYTAALLAFVGATTVSARGTFQYFQNNGIDYGSDYIRIPPNNLPITDINSPLMACNVNGNIAKPGVAKVAAGSVVTVEFHKTGRDSEGIEVSHKGPTLAYLAKVPDATSSSAVGLDWFKIFEDDSVFPWATDKFNAKGGKWSFTIPKSIPNGDYLLRAEVIALHLALQYPGAQFFLGCAQIRVSGGTGGVPPTVGFPGAYKSSDPGVTFNIYNQPTDYTPPGPPVYT